MQYFHYIADKKCNELCEYKFSQSIYNIMQKICHHLNSCHILIIVHHVIIVWIIDVKGIDLIKTWGQQFF